MALTPIRWLAALVTACLVCSIAVLRVREPKPPARGAEELGAMRRDTYSSMVRDAARKLRLAQVVDSTRRESAKAAPAPIRVFIGASVPVVARGPLDSLVARATRNVRDAGRIGIDVFVMQDSLSHIRGAWNADIYGTSVDYVLPRREDGRCSVILRFGKNPGVDWLITKVFRTEQAEQQLLGPCAYYQAFGIPGPSIDAWLRRGGWAFAGDGSWSTAAAPVDRSDVTWLSIFPRFESQLWDVTVDGAHCEMRQVNACERVLFSPVTTRWSRFSFLNDSILRSPYLPLARSRERYYGRTLGVRQPFLLADMVRTLGKDRFARFWASSQSPAAAFQAAAGEPVTDWASRWIAAQYGESSSAGPGLTFWAATLSALLIIAGVGVALRLSEARQFA